MNWEVIFREESLAMYGEGIVTTLWLLLSSLAVGAAGGLPAWASRSRCS